MTVKPDGGAPHRTRSQEGSTLLELVAGTFILYVALMGITAMFLGMVRLNAQSHESTRLAVACRNVIESLRAASFASLTTEYGPNSSKNAFWCESDGRVTFSTDASLPDDAWATGRIELFNNEGSIPQGFAGLSGGFDLNGDGVVSSSAVSDYEVLPVRLTVQILDSPDPRTVTLDVVLSETKSW